MAEITNKIRRSLGLIYSVVIGECSSVRRCPGSKVDVNEAVISAINRLRRVPEASRNALSARDPPRRANVVVEKNKLLFITPTHCLFKKGVLPFFTPI